MAANPDEAALLELRDACYNAGILLREHYTARHLPLKDLVERLIRVDAAASISDVRAALRGLPAGRRPPDKRAARPSAAHLGTAAQLLTYGDLTNPETASEWGPPPRCDVKLWAGLPVSQQAALRRAAEAVRIMRDADAAEDAARVTRMRACAALHVTYGEPQARRYKRYSIDRSVFERQLHSVSAALPTFPSRADAADAADAAHHRYVRQRSIKETARAVRDVTVADLANPRRAGHLRNNEIARITGMSPQLVEWVRASARRAA